MRVKTRDEYERQIEELERRAASAEERAVFWAEMASADRRRLDQVSAATATMNHNLAAATEGARA